MTDFRASGEAAPIESIDQLVEEFHLAGKPRERWTIGTEYEKLAVDPERVPRARGRVPRHPLGPAGRITPHRESPLPVGEPELDAARGRSPETEARGAVVACLGAERHPVRAPYCGPSPQAGVLGLRSRSTASERASRG